VLIEKNFEEGYRPPLVGFSAVSWQLIRPTDDTVLSVVSAEGVKVLGVPGVVELSHILQHLACAHAHTSE
jgi:hypothetical protein